MRTAWCLPLLVGQAFAGAAHAADDSEVWPELSAYIATSPDTRLFLDVSYARGDTADTAMRPWKGLPSSRMRKIARKRRQT